MGEFASKGVAGAGLGLGIAGTALGLLAGSNNGNGLLGGLFGGGYNQAAMMASAANQAVLSEKDATIARLTSEKYADHVGIDVYKQARADNTDLQDRLLGNWIKPLAQESAANRERLATLEAQFKCEGEKTLLREQLIEQKFMTANVEMNRRVDEVANKAACGIASNAAGIAALRQVVDGITQTIIPQTAICPPVMPRYNTWEAPTDTAPATQPITGTINRS